MLVYRWLDKYGGVHLVPHIQYVSIREEEAD